MCPVDTFAKAEAPTEAAAETLSSETRLRERKGKALMYFKPFSPSVAYRRQLHLTREPMGGKTVGFD